MKNMSIYQGDCLEIMKKLHSGSIDLVVTSPPYNLLNTTGKQGESHKWKSSSLLNGNGYDEHHDNMPHHKYVQWQRECLREMMRLIPESGAIYYNHKWRVQDGKLQDRNDIISGFPVRQIIIWDRCGGINFNQGYHLPTYEVIYLIAKSKFKLTDSKFGDIWRIPPDSKNSHPAPFPVELARRCITTTNAKMVLDPFCGSGTTGIASLLEGRNFKGIDLSEKYCEIAKKRIEKQTSEMLPFMTISK